MPLFKKIVNKTYLWITIGIGAVLFLAIFLWYTYTTSAIVNYNLLTVNQNLMGNASWYEAYLFSDHLHSLSEMKLTEEKKQIEDAYNSIKSTEQQATIQKIDAIYTLYQQALAKIERNKKVSVSTTTAEDQIGNWGKMLLEKKYDEVNTQITDANKTLDDGYNQYLASLPPPSPSPAPTPTPSPNPNPTTAQGYQYKSVSTGRGTFGMYLIKLPLSGVTVKTVTANTQNCTNNCPAKPLAEYVAENNAYAGINGSYFCPPDYSSCAGKTYSYDFAVFNSNTHTWLNSVALKWNDLGLAAFVGKTPLFYDQVKSYDGSTVTAGISNFPELLKNGNVVLDENKLSAYQKNTKGLRGAIGVDSSNVYLAIITGANVPDAAVAMQSLGVKDALNLDGGGSSALYIGGSYKVGPGRRLPNAIVLVK